MPRPIVEASPRLQLRVSPAAKAKLAQAAAIMQTDLTQFVTQTALREAEAVIAADQAARLSARDYQLILDLLERPPAPNAKLRAALAAVPDTL